MKNETPIPVYEYSNYRDYLRAVTRLTVGVGQRPYSLSKWAQKLGYQSPRIVSMVLNGQRVPSGEMVQAWSRALGHTFQQRRYFELLVQLEKNRRRGKAVADVLAELGALVDQSAPAQPPHRLVLDARKFSYVAEWFHIAIRQLLKARPGDTAWIYKKLRKKVHRLEVKRALSNLVELGLVRFLPDTNTYEVLPGQVTTTADVPSEAIRLHHRQMMARAQEALYEQDVLEREITSATVRFERTRLAEAKKVLRDFRDEFERRFSSETSEEVYQMNLQFFSHTDVKVKGGDDEDGEK